MNDSVILVKHEINNLTTNSVSNNLTAVVLSHPYFKSCGFHLEDGEHR